MSMCDSSLQSTRVFWRDMLHREQREEDLSYYNEKKRSNLGWFHKNGLARASENLSG